MLCQRWKSRYIYLIRGVFVFYKLKLYIDFYIVVEEKKVNTQRLR